MGAPPSPLPPAQALAWVGVGANLGQAAETVNAAIAACAALPGCRLLARSALYRSAPVEADGDDYINAVLQLATRLSPLALLDGLQQIELQHGRLRSHRNAPRTLDLDLLLYGTQPLTLPRLQLPHPRMHLRAFVLLPLAELAPGLAIPGQGLVQDLLPAVQDQRIQRL